MYSKYNHIWCKLSVFCTFRSKFLSLSGEDLILQKLEMIKLSWGGKKKNKQQCWTGQLGPHEPKLLVLLWMLLFAIYKCFLWQMGICICVKLVLSQFVLVMCFCNSLQRLCSITFGTGYCIFIYTCVRWQSLFEMWQLSPSFCLWIWGIDLFIWFEIKNFILFCCC